LRGEESCRLGEKTVRHIKAKKKSQKLPGRRGKKVPFLVEKKKWTGQLPKEGREGSSVLRRNVLEWRTELKGGDLPL